MDKLEKAILGKKRWEGLNIFIEAIKDNKEENPNIALDNSKSILESIAKTILKDKEIKFKNDENIGNLVKKTFSSLPVFMKLSKRDSESGKKILNAFSTIVSGIGEFRNSYGFFAHGQDIESRNFDNYLVELVIQSSDLLSNFLIISHSEDLKNRKRMYYEEYPDFNKWFDENEEWARVKEIEHSPSRVLFYSDQEFYKQELIEFENNAEIQISIFENTENKEEIFKNLLKLEPVLSNIQLKSINKVFKQQKEFVDKIQNSLNGTGMIEAMDRLKKQLQPAVESINKINQQLNQKREYIKEELRDEILDEELEDLRGQQEYQEWKDGR